MFAGNAAKPCLDGNVRFWVGILENARWKKVDFVSKCVYNGKQFNKRREHYECYVLHSRKF